MGKLFRFKKKNLENDYSGKFARFINCGKVKKFDQAFYDSFDGMYFNGLPVYYYFKRMNMHKCFETSAILALAMGKESCVCRGELSTLSKFHEQPFVHGWVELGDEVYDTTFQIICRKSIYEKIYKPKRVQKFTQEEYMEYAKEVSDWNIRTKEWFENNYHSGLLLAYQVRQLEQFRLDHENVDEQEKKFINKVLADLPAQGNCPEPEIDFGRIF